MATFCERAVISSTALPTTPSGSLNFRNYAWSRNPENGIQSETHSRFAAMYLVGGDVGSGFHSLEELNQPASRRTFGGLVRRER